jgi:hypothetical protein
MSPIPAGSSDRGQDDAKESKDAKTPKAIPNKRAEGEDLDALEMVVRAPEEVEADPKQFQVEARVVYLGGDKKKSVYIQGSVTLEETETEGETIWVPTSDGATTYDFSKTDSNGRLVRERLTKDGRPFSLCRHIGHLVKFLSLRDGDGGQAFEVRAKPTDYPKIERYARLLLEKRQSMTETGPSLLASMGMS